MHPWEVMNLGVYDERRVKIVATLGPASRDRETLREMIEAGLDVVRINAAHGSPDERARLVQDVRAVFDEVGHLVPVLFDLRGTEAAHRSGERGRDGRHRPWQPRRDRQ